MRHESRITVYSPAPAAVGRLRLDPLGITGEGGGLVPVLTIPIQAQLFEDEGGLLILERLEATLWTASVDRGGVELAGPAVALGIGGSHGVVTARPPSFSPDLLNMRFGLSREGVRVVHDRARSTSPSAIAFELRFQATLGRMPGSVADGLAALNSSPVAVGLASHWQTHVEDMQIEVSREHWTDVLSPRLGEDRARIVVVDFPAAGGPLGAQVAELFDAARRAYDAGDHRECIQKCRDVRNYVEQSIRTEDDARVAATVAQRVGAPVDDPRVEFLDRAWKALGDFTSDSHHVHTAGRLDGASAHAALLMTATLVQLVAELIAPV